ncbi:SDR family NAD(P)-dependent oxidoreductase [Rhizobium giardinii]|uniref:SDR family NAD(P)-dependent oxidoreductase n=1 Tax=Rhizobium giardinii TaxID=56731 RepID=UPI003D70103F
MTNSIMIIGAGPGIGQAVAEKFGREGWHVVLTARNADRLADLSATLSRQGLNVSAVQGDATDPVALRKAIAEGDITGRLTAVLFNAAVVREQDLFSMSDDEVTDDLAINVAAGLHTIRASVEPFGARGGTILITGGGLAVSPHAGYASLGLGKAALRNVVEGLAGPLAERGIRIAVATIATIVGPGSTEAREAADTIWMLSTDPTAGWEIVYPRKRLQGRLT